LEEIVPVPTSDVGTGWYSSFFESRKEMEKLEVSGKLVVLFEILKTCELIGDKVLVFSQFLTSLDLIETYLADLDEEGQKKKDDSDQEVTFPPTSATSATSAGRWRPNIEYFRIDGSVKTDDRQRHCDTFNAKAASR
jgi:transcriptional regulator ATRX